MASSAMGSILGSSGFCRPRTQKEMQNRCVHDLRQPCSVVCVIFIFTLRLSMRWTAVILIMRKTWRPPIWGPCWDQDGSGSGISGVYLWFYLVNWSNLKFQHWNSHYRPHSIPQIMLFIIAHSREIFVVHVKGISVCDALQQNGEQIGYFPGGGGTQIWIGQGCAASSLKPIPMFRGNFSKDRYPYSGIFLKKGLISCKKLTQNCGASVYVLTCVYPPPQGLVWDMGSWSWHKGEKLFISQVWDFCVFTYHNMFPITPR